MKLLKDKILNEGRCLPGGILKVDSFLNHQMDPKLMKEMAVELAQRFEGCGATKILTIEASGIAPAIMVGCQMNLPVVFAKKKVPSTMDGVITASVYSFTKKCNYTICVSSEFLGKNDKVLFIDDFLANGNAGIGASEIVEQSGAMLVGMGFLVEKSFQAGREILERLDVKIESLARIASLDDGVVKFVE